VVDRDWDVEVVPLVVGQRSVKEKEWLETLRIFGINKEDGKRIIGRLGYTLLNENEKFSVVTGDTHSGPPVVYYSYWGKTYWFVLPIPLKEDSDEGLLWSTTRHPLYL
jgi:hypothetical protein